MIDAKFNLFVLPLTYDDNTYVLDRMLNYLKLRQNYVKVVKTMQVDVKVRRERFVIEDM